MEVGFVDTDRFFQLLDVLGSTLPEGRLGLTVTLFALLRGSIYLSHPSAFVPLSGVLHHQTYGFPSTFPLLLTDRFLRRAGLWLWRGGVEVHGILGGFPRRLFVVNRHAVCHCSSVGEFPLSSGPTDHPSINHRPRELFAVRLLLGHPLPRRGAGVTSSLRY